MAESRLPQRVAYPSSSAMSGELYDYLTKMAQALNAMPTFSYYSGNPNSNLTANVGALVCNIASTATARLWVKIYCSSNTGWASLTTSP